MNKRDNGSFQTLLPDLSIELPSFSADSQNPQVYVGNCAFSFVCSKKWSDLKADAISPDRRFCETCNKDVHRVYTSDEFARRGRAGECVAISSLEDHEAFSVDDDLAIMGLPIDDDEEGLTF